MIWAILNLLLSFFEVGAMWFLLYRFMNINNRMVYRKKAWYVAGFTLAGILQYFLSFIFREGWVPILVCVLMTTGISAFLFHRKTLPIVLDVLFLVVLILAMEMGIFVNHLFALRITFTNLAQAGCLYMASKILLMCMVALPIINWRKNLSEGNLTIKQSAAVLVLPGFSLFFLYSIVKLCRVYVELYGIKLAAANMGALLIVNLYFLYLFRKLLLANKLEQEMKAIQVKNQVQYRYYEELEEKYKESRKIFHDMKNHLQAVEQLYGEQDKAAGENYVKDLYHMINVLGEKHYSSNHMLNIILNEKLSRAQKLGISVKVEPGDADFNDLKDMDITTIFANLLDNAVEACEKSGEGAYLHLKINTVQDFRVICLSNSRTNDSEKMVTEHQTSHMGLGLVNVRQTLEKYHGSLEQTVSDDVYQVSIMIPGKE